MTVEEFCSETLASLALSTGIHKSRWSRYLNRRVDLTEKTLNAAAAKLCMSPEILLQAMNKRRELRGARAARRSA